MVATPTTLKEALELRSSQNIIPYGGGTDLMIEADASACYLHLHRVAEMTQITEDDKYIRFGAACTFAQVAQHALCPPPLREAVLQIAAPAIRNLGTIGGNIGNGSAKADSALVFFACDAVLRLVSLNGERTVPVSEFYLGRKKLDLSENELIAEVLFPKNRICQYYYQKVGARSALAISRISFAGLMDIADGKIQHCATAFGAVSDVIIRRADIDEMLIGKTIAEAKAAKAAYIAAFDQAIVPIRGRVSIEYRKTVCMNLLCDFLNSMGI